MGVLGAGREQGNLAPVFSDHMVLQRDMVLPIWGTATAGQKVAVAFNGSEVSAVATAEGKWRMEFPAQSVSKTPRELRLSIDGSARTIVKDVLVGDVWVCAGQSNMEFRCNQESTWKTESTVAEFPHVRLRNMGYAGQGYFGTPYSPDIVARQTPEEFYNASTWEACSASSAAKFSAVGYFFAKEIHTALDVPIGVINMSVGGSPAESWVSRDSLSSNPEFAAMTRSLWLSNRSVFEAWCLERASVQLGARLSSAPTDEMGPHHSFKPGFLWSAGPARLAPFPIRGVLWYQGESNALSHRGESGVANPQWRVEQHVKIFPVLVSDWRKAWRQEAMPFLVCQLSSIGEKSYHAHFWPEFRDQQRHLADIVPRVGLAVTSDIGDPTNVHPANKRDVGKRLAAWARRHVYDDPAVLACPMPTSARGEGATVRVMFRDAGKTLATRDGAEPASFELAGADGRFVPAIAAIDRDTILVSASSVSAPIRVRYGWQPYSTGNLINAAGLPTSTFALNVTR